MLNAQLQGIEFGVTVTRLSETAFYQIVPGATRRRDLAGVRRHIGERFVVITDDSAGEAVVPLMDPKSRERLSRLPSNDFSNDRVGRDLGLGQRRMIGCPTGRGLLLQHARQGL